MTQLRRRWIGWLQDQLRRELERELGPAPEGFLVASSSTSGYDAEIDGRVTKIMWSVSATFVR